MNENKTSVDCFFEQLGGSCGVCATNVLLKMWGLPGVIFRFIPSRVFLPKKFFGYCADRVLMQNQKESVFAILSRGQYFITRFQATTMW